MSRTKAPPEPGTLASVKVGDLIWKRYRRGPSSLIEVTHSSPKGYIYMANCHASGSRIWVLPVGYQGPTSRTKSEALRYLEWLDAGNNGRHFEALRGE
jgi:hypothetical protein